MNTRLNNLGTDWIRPEDPNCMYRRLGDMIEYYGPNPRVLLPKLCTDLGLTINEDKGGIACSGARGQAFITEWQASQATLFGFTGANAEPKTDCRNCGAPPSYGACEYCGSV